MPRRVVVAGVAAVAVAGIAVTGALLWPTEDGAAADDGDRAEGATVAAERRTLTDAERVSGQLEYADTFTVSATGAGTLTALPDEGSVVRRGDAAYRVDDVPVPLLVGDLPMWRELDITVSDGRDVRQLERNLAKLGYDPGTVDRDFTGYTEAALLDLQEDLGIEETGRAAPGDFVIAPGRVLVGAVAARVGQPLSPGAELYTASGTDHVVVVELDPADEALARVDAPADVTLPSGKEVAATVSSVGVVETTTAADGSSTSVLPITLALDKPAAVADLSLAPVNVDLTRETKADVLAVPVTALVALAEGGHAVHRVEDGTPELVAVETGLYADGYVEVLDGIAEGDEVVVAE